MQLCDESDTVPQPSTGDKRAHCISSKICRNPRQPCALVLIFYQNTDVFRENKTFSLNGTEELMIDSK